MTASSFTPSNIGFVGLGIMGAPMAGNLVAAGHRLFVTTCGAMRTSIADGSAIVCLHAREVAERADIVITTVPDTPDVASALFGEESAAPRHP